MATSIPIRQAARVYFSERKFGTVRGFRDYARVKYGETVQDRQANFAFGDLVSDKFLRRIRPRGSRPSNIFVLSAYTIADDIKRSRYDMLKTASRRNPESMPAVEYTEEVPDPTGSYDYRPHTADEELRQILRIIENE